MLAIRCRRLSDKGPPVCQTQRWLNPKEKPKSAGLLKGSDSTSVFFPPVSTVQGSKRSEARPKMDNFVPTLGMTSVSFATSPYSSIYDMDRSEITALCDVPAPLSNPGMEDICNLDENLENSTLKSFLTPDVITSLKAPAREAVSTEFLWAAKVNKAHVTSTCSGNVGHNPTLAQLNAEAFGMDDILGVDQESSKLSDSSFDCFYSDVKPSPGYRPLTQFQPSAASPFDSNATVVVSSQGIVCESTVQTAESLSSLGNSYMRNMTPMKNVYFPPRQNNPLLVGVVTPVKQPEPVQSAFIKQEQTTNKPLATQAEPSILLQELLGKNSMAQIKSEPGSNTDSTYEKQSFPLFSSYSGSDTQSQIVPNSESRKRDSDSAFKSQLSPSIKRESSEDTWRDIVSLIHEDAEFEQPPKRRRKDSGSSGHMSNDEEDDEDDDNRSLYGENNGGDDSDDDMSDIDADLTHVLPGQQESLIPSTAGTVGGKKQTKPIQYFWQYNVQAKGPKGTRLKLAVESPADPHILNDFEDPVFDECNTSIAGIRHGGKARKGDGNEISPNPRKLYLIGLQLARLNKKINACCQQINCPSGSGVSVAQRNASRKEKNKLASRACRLKKKAQHEANKIKLHGLAIEHRQLNSVSKDVWAQLRERVQASLRSSSDQAGPSKPQQPLTSSLGPTIDNMLENTEVQVAGHSVTYVNSVILKVEAGDSDGGLHINKRRQQQKSS